MGSPFGFFQFFKSLEDKDAILLLKMLTFLPMSEINALVTSMGEANFKPFTLQQILAEEVTRLVHGEEALLQAVSITETLFAKGESNTKLTFDVLKSIADDGLLGDQHLRIPRASVQERAFLEVLVESKLFTAFGKPAPAKHIETLASQ